MAFSGLDEDKRQKMELESRLEMERLSIRLKELILSQPPQDLLAYIWSQLLMSSMVASSDDERVAEDNASAEEIAHKDRDQLNITQFVLEYIHATLSAFKDNGAAAFSELACADLFENAERLQAATSRYCMFSSAGSNDGIFGPKTGEIEFMAKSLWASLRGNRHQVLEQEFFNFVLEPHDEVLRRTFGVGAIEIAAGIQNIVDSMRLGHMRAANTLEEQVKAAYAYAEERGLTLDQAAEKYRKEHPEHLLASANAFNDLFKGDICNLSKHTKLPPSFLEALAFERGGNIDFFAPGPLSGTPLRTLPARVKPLVKLDGEYFATDHAFVRDSGYRCILWNLLNLNPTYRNEFECRQKDMSETAFFRVLAAQLKGASVHREIWYKDTVTRQWAENDTLVRLDDVLILVEAKAGAAATIASPAVDFDRHVRAVQDLVMKAYTQCRRFFEYLNSAAEVPIFKREFGKYIEFDRIRLNDYRVAIPIGLTVESFSPFSAMCKELPGIEPILGSHPFISMSIDDLFVLKRFLPTSGEFMHYMEVRQSVAGIKGSHLFDEMDHLGAYISQNRFDEVQREQLSEGADIAWWDGFSDKVDNYFEGENWENKPPPKQEYPEEMTKLLDALNSTRASGWLGADSHIRNLGHEGRNNLASMLCRIRESLAKQVSRWFQFGDSPPLFVWLQRTGTTPDIQLVHFKAKAAAMAADSSNSIAVLAFVTPRGGYSQAVRIFVDAPVAGAQEHAAILVEVDRMKSRQVPLDR